MNAENTLIPRAQFSVISATDTAPAPPPSVPRRSNNDGVGVFQHLSGLFRRDFAMFASF